MCSWKSRKVVLFQFSAKNICRYSSIVFNFKKLWVSSKKVNKVTFSRQEVLISTRTCVQTAIFYTEPLYFNNFMCKYYRRYPFISSRLNDIFCNVFSTSSQFLVDQLAQHLKIWPKIIELRVEYLYGVLSWYFLLRTRLKFTEGAYFKREFFVTAKLWNIRLIHRR